jgi:AcrR family transcriptional regulator
MTPTERMQATERKAEILSAALPVFAMKGFAATTTKDLAQAAQVSEGLLYKHFPSKENLYFELGLAICGQSNLVSQNLVKMQPSTQGLIQALYYLTRIIYKGPIGRGQEHDHLLRMMCRSLLEDGVFARTFLESTFLPYIEPLETLFAAARAEGHMHSTVPADRFCIFFAHHMVIGVRLHGLKDGSAEEPAGVREKRFQELVHFTMRGVGLKDEALQQHLDFERLDLWYEQAFQHAVPGVAPLA